MSSRLLVIDEKGCVLLFKFVFKEGPLAGTEFWATPGGELHTDESFEEAARRELYEETGIQIDKSGNHFLERQFELLLPTGERVNAIERYFTVRTNRSNLDAKNQTLEEREILVNHKWWDIDELHSTSDKIYPEDIVDILTKQHI